ncbi:sugar transferase [Devosia sp.]|uniref:sugar transferase n=1 Tax=Devosia sp. TaxID=1871048 RepID=UPI001AC0DA39|nr:sugar transferase [Devosia sp.]MBN9333393.1 sugar transferase [Devosia sp.]
MNRTSNPFGRAEFTSTPKVESHPGSHRDYSRAGLIPYQLLRQQTGLPVHWRNGRLVRPRDDKGRRSALFVKRGIDIAGALIGLLLLSPLFLAIALQIKLADKGPIFFRQKRIGQNGRLFELLKFRSMHADRCDAAGLAQVTANDNRITRIGAFIRRTSIDELPQLLNVLRGDMALVGPRPHVSGMLAAGTDYQSLVPNYAFRHEMRPGLTGWAQCNGLRGPTTDRVMAMNRIGHDFAYVQNFSLWLDLRIIGRTIAGELLRAAAL